MNPSEANAPMLAYCWATGLIELGEGVPDGAILIASGPKDELHSFMETVARHGQGASEGKLLVPGVPEAASQRDGLAALVRFMKWLATRPNRNFPNVTVV